MASRKGGMDMSRFRGEQVSANVVRATKHGIDTIMAQSVVDAKEDVPVATASYQGSIRIVEPADKHGDEIAGVWGSTDINYALGLETGDFSYLAGAQPLGGESANRVETRRNKGHRGSLRKSADRNYPNLADEIRKRLA